VTTVLVDPLAAASFSADAFAPDALYAYWDGSGDETAARAIASGREEIRAALSAWPAPEALVAAQDGRDCFVEGRLADGATFVAALQIGADGKIARCLSFHCPAVEPPSSWSAPAPQPPGSARTVLDHYFESLSAGRFEDACACFSEDCLYSHPPYNPGAARVEFHGRGELLAGFENVRGARPSRLPRIVCCVQNGSDCFIEGVVDGDPPRGSFVSSVLLDSDGLIRRYVAFYSDSRVPRL
jgi:SnoaL-like protein